jgi:DNA polymerase III subunit delta'
MPFSDFHGNVETVTRVREMLGRDRFPHAVIIAGPRGAGKYTLALMVTRAMNCLEQPVTDGLPDFCGSCANCVRVAEALDLEARCGEALEARDGLRETDKKETRILIQPHPDVLVVPPDPPQMTIKVDQVRHVNHTIYFRPSQARRRVVIFTDSAFMKEAANALLKTLEEPPDYATLFLLTENAGELLPTIRSRSVIFKLAPLQAEEIERALAERRPELNPKQRALVARLSGGAIGRARSFDLAAYIEARNDALVLLRSAVGGEDHSALFHVTETYRAGAEGKQKTDQLVSTVYSLLEDMLFAKSGTPDLARNTDIITEIKRLAGAVDFAWIARASSQLGEFERAMRRNVLRSLALDALALGQESVVGRQ